MARDIERELQEGAKLMTAFDKWDAIYRARWDDTQRDLPDSAPPIHRAADDAKEKGIVRATLAYLARRLP